MDIQDGSVGKSTWLWKLEVLGLILQLSYRKKKKDWAWWPLITAFWSQWQVSVCELQVSLFYISNSRLALAR